MSYLLYCIVSADHPEPRAGIGPLGYPRAAVMVRAAGLGAVLSEASRSDLAPDVPRLLAYAAVIDLYNRERTVIPLRFGSRFANLAEVARLLERERQRWSALLHELDGRVEMSVRVTACDCVEPEISGAHPANGVAYLEERRRYYARKDEARRRGEEIAARLCALARGGFVRHTGPLPGAESPRAFSISFLVARDAVAAFAERLQPLVGRDDPQIAITGPWPPYNFVASAR